MPAKLRVAVIGGGISGLTLAAALGSIDKDREVEVDIYEASLEFAEIGAGINIWLRVWEMLRNIGLQDTVYDLLTYWPDETPHVVFEIRKSDQQKGIAVLDMMVNGGSLRFHRADFQRALLKHVPPNCQLHLSHRLKSYIETEDSVELQFENGATATCDLLGLSNGSPGSDYEKSIYPVFSGNNAYRGLVPVDLLQKRYPGHRAITSPAMYCGKNKHLIVYPVSKGHLLNVVAYFSEYAREGEPISGATTTNATVEEIMATYSGWEEEVLALLSCIDSPTKWAVQTLIPLDCWGKGRVLLVGDAAHAMTPHQGMGAGQAIEDAYILANILANSACNRKSIPRIVEVYDAIRRPVGNGILEGSRTQGMRCEFYGSEFEKVVEGDDISLENLKEHFEIFANGFNWVGNTSAEVEKEKALDMLRQ